MTDTRNDTGERDLQDWTARTYGGLADLLTASATETWDAPTLCEG